MREDGSIVPKIESELLVLGRTSYIGGSILAQAAREGISARGIGRDECDLSDAQAVRALFGRLDDTPKTVIVAAVRNKPIAPEYESFLENTAIVHNVARACGEGKIRSVVYLSSVDVYGARAPVPITEQTPLNPDTWYGIAKHNGEWILRNSREVGVPVAILRIPGVYGPAPNDRSVVGRMVRDARTDGSIIIRGSGSALRDYVHLEDLYKVVLRVAQLSSNVTLNVATGTSRSIHDIADLVRHAVGRDVRLLHEPGDDRGFDLSFDPTFLRSYLPDVRLRDLSQGIGSYLKEHRRTHA